MTMVSTTGPGNTPFSDQMFATLTTFCCSSAWPPAEVYSLRSKLPRRGRKAVATASASDPELTGRCDCAFRSISLIRYRMCS